MCIMEVLNTLECLEMLSDKLSYASFLWGSLQSVVFNLRSNGTCFCNWRARVHIWTPNPRSCL